MEHFQALILGLVHTYGYAGLFLVMVLGNVAVPVGTEIVLPVAGAAAGAGHLSSWVLVGAIATAGEVVGGLALYAVGYYAGEPAVHRFGQRGERELARVHAFYARYGDRTVFICRFIPFIRGIASLPAGISRMPKRYFLTYHALGSAIFCFSLAYVGFAFGQRLDAIVPMLRHFSVALVAAVVVALAVVAVMRRRIGVKAGF